MDGIARMLGELFPAECRPADNDLRKASAIMSLAAAAMAERMAEEAVASLSTIGVKPAQFGLLKFMAYAARLQMEKLSLLGLPRRDQLVLSHTARVKEFLATSTPIVNAGDYLDAAYFWDVGEYMMRHFMPTKRLSE